jgi:hypothetical protein
MLGTPGKTATLSCSFHMSHPSDVKMTSPLPQPFQLQGLESESEKWTIDHGQDLPDYYTPPSHERPFTPCPETDPIPDIQQLESTSSGYEPALDVSPTYDSFDSNFDMQEKMKELCRELEVLKSTVDWMHGVQDTQNRAISRLLLLQRREISVTAPYEPRV